MNNAYAYGFGLGLVFDESLQETLDRLIETNMEEGNKLALSNPKAARERFQNAAKFREQRTKLLREQSTGN